MEAFLTDIAQSLPGVLLGYALAALVVFAVKKAVKTLKKRQADIWRKHMETQMANNTRNLRSIGYMK